MTVLVVIAHPGPASFTASWARASIAAVEAQGKEVLVSDLCAMGFDPVERPGDEGTQSFDVLKMQQAASETGTLPADIATEVDKIRAADTVILHFPLWWFAPPAILKGWCERALVHGALHDVDNRFDTGLCRGKRVLFCVSTGADEIESGPDGREGETRLLLWPLAQTFRYLGFSVLEPELVHGVHGYNRDDRKAQLETRLCACLDAQAGLIAGLHHRAVWPFNVDTDFDRDGRLRPEAPSHSPFIQHCG